MNHKKGCNAFRGICLFMLLLLMLPACSKEDSPATLPPTDSAAFQDEGSGFDDAPLYESGTLSEETEDLGTACSDHQYRLSSGASDTLRFSKKLSSSQQTRDTSFTKNTDELAATGVEVSLDYPEYQTITVPFPVWALDYSAYMDEMHAEIDRRKARNPNAQIGINALQSVTVNGWRLDLAFDTQNGHYIIQRVNNVSGPRAVGALSREKLAEMLGLPGPYDAPDVHDGFLNRSITTPIIESSMDEEITFLTYAVSVRTPSSGGIRDTRTRQITFIPASGSGQGIGIGVRSSWGQGSDPNALSFIISGPAEDPECFGADPYWN